MKHLLSTMALETYHPIFNVVKLFNNVNRLAFLASSIFLLSCSDQQQQGAPPPPSLPVVAISSGQQTVYQEYPASIEGTANVEIRPQVEGTLDIIYVDEGAKVRKGQALFKINDRPYQEQLNQALANLHAAEAALVNAEIEVEKKTKLVNNKVLADFQLKTAVAARNVAKANLEQAKAGVGSARINLGYTVIKAPTDGYIGRLLKKQGSLVTPADAQALTDLSDIHELHVYFALGENDFVSFKNNFEGATLEEKLKKLPPITLVLSDQTEYAQQGKIDMVDGQFDKNTGAITLRATFPNKEGLLRSGNTGKVRLGKQHAKVLLVPQMATLEMQDKIFVYTVNDSNKVNKQPIEVIGKSGASYLVKSGVKDGDHIVYKGMDLLQEDQVIAPQQISADSLKLTAYNK
ncbi:efflux RND transporter periplasmic adaptor subunit [Olivibacter domesticus]|uniref:Membrane fusion protein, multidrug efflux system n=1 Tax=Olivibacter domesticus TaxID=407022 RepID=A0A1H7QIR4_OLID1|nr:efflux RND transporter periplasmic adaptor subunit [Olivibacter domesticus]SEL47842.1 membrane fusion protein, multidrug efflux system [Olivibacter domesticus]